jgi:hypothetical protein
MRFCLLWLALAVGVSAEARVFNYKDSTVAPYLRVTGGLSSLGQSAFKDSSGTGTSVDGTSKYSYGGELGLVLAITPSFHMRFGAELMQSRPVTYAPGSSSSGTELFRLDSTMSVFNPNVTFEGVFKSTGATRYFGMAGVGLASLTLENKYAMTSAGTSALGVSDFDEKMTGSAVESHLGVGFETLFTDNATFSMDLGYRYLIVKSLKYKSDVNNIVSPSGVHAGDPVLNSDGSARKLNLSGVNIGVSFRFYLNFI